jgi:hypothetical protein
MIAFAPRQHMKTCACGRPIVAAGMCSECARKHRADGPRPHTASPGTPTASRAERIGVPAVPGSARDFSRVPLHASPTREARMRVGTPHSRDERQADAAAAAFAARPARTGPDSPSRAQRESPHTRIQPLAATSAPMQRVPPSVSEVTHREPGRPLDPGLASAISTHLGSDIRTARIHDGGGAAASARGVRARAYTVGNHVVFGAGQYAPAAKRASKRRPTNQPRRPKPAPRPMPAPTLHPPIGARCSSRR